MGVYGRVKCRLIIPLQATALLYVFAVLKQKSHNIIFAVSGGEGKRRLNREGRTIGRRYTEGVESGRLAIATVDSAPYAIRKPHRYHCRGTDCDQPRAHSKSAKARGGHHQSRQNEEPTTDPLRVGPDFRVRQGPRRSNTDHPVLGQRCLRASTSSGLAKWQTLVTEVERWSRESLARSSCRRPFKNRDLVYARVNGLSRGTLAHPTRDPERQLSARSCRSRTAALKYRNMIPYETLAKEGAAPGRALSCTSNPRSAVTEKPCRRMYPSNSK